MKYLKLAILFVVGMIAGAVLAYVFSKPHCVMSYACAPANLCCGVIASL